MNKDERLVDLALRVATSNVAELFAELKTVSPTTYTYVLGVMSAPSQIYGGDSVKMLIVHSSVIAALMSHYECEITDQNDDILIEQWVSFIQKRLEPSIN
jgi:hypothetical protein